MGDRELLELAAKLDLNIPFGGIFVPAASILEHVKSGDAVLSQQVRDDIRAAASIGNKGE